MISALTYDLPLEPLEGVENFQTEHELMFRESGIPIKALRAPHQSKHCAHAP